jgi:hypothetical protein
MARVRRGFMRGVVDGDIVQTRREQLRQFRRLDGEFAAARPVRFAGDSFDMGLVGVKGDKTGSKKNIQKASPLRSRRYRRLNCSGFTPSSRRWLHITCSLCPSCTISKKINLLPASL